MVEPPPKKKIKQFKFWIFWMVTLETMDCVFFTSHVMLDFTEGVKQPNGFPTLHCLGSGGYPRTCENLAFLLLFLNNMWLSKVRLAGSNHLLRWERFRVRYLNHVNGNYTLVIIFMTMASLNDRGTYLKNTQEPTLQVVLRWYDDKP